MDKYIQDLIASNNSVILPGFGALSLTNAEPREIMFNEYLTFNDGKLESYIAEQEGIDKQDAANMISKFVRELELLLNKGETYDIFQFGRFIKKPDGGFDFENWKSFSEEGSSTYVSPVKPEGLIEEPSKFQENKQEHNEPKVRADEPAETPSLKKEIISEEEMGSIKEVYEKPAERTLTEEEKKQSKNKFTPADVSDKVDKEKVSEKPKEPVKEPIKPASGKNKVEAKKPKEKVEKKVKSDKPKKKRGVFFVPLIIFLILIGAAGTFIGIFPDEAKKLVGWEDVNRKEPVDETPEQTDEIVNTDYSEEDDFDEYTEEDVTADIAEGFQETVKEDVKVPVQATSGSFHIIVGSFSELQNAENLSKTLQSKGYDAKVIGPVNNLHMVSFSAYESREAAQGNLQKAIEETGGGWILKR